MLGVVIFAHGSRDPLWRAPVEAVARRIAQRAPNAAVACAYLELCEPDLMTATRALLAQGVDRVRVLPLFFGMGKHAREDLPVLLAQLTEAHPGVRFECLPAAGESEPLRDLLADLALTGEPSPAPSACSTDLPPASAGAATRSTPDTP